MEKYTIVFATKTNILAQVIVLSFAFKLSDLSSWFVNSKLCNKMLPFSNVFLDNKSLIKIQTAW